jgi:hypothetical protein
MIRALRPPSRLASGLHGRKEQGYQDANDGDDYKQLDQRKCRVAWPSAAEQTHIVILAMLTKFVSKRNICDIDILLKFRAQGDVTVPR